MTVITEAARLMQSQTVEVSREMVISLQGVAKSFETPDGPIHALGSTDLKIANGESAEGHN